MMKIVVKNSDDLKKRIIKKGYSVSGFAREINIPEGYASQIVNATKNPGPDYAKKITEFLEVDFDEVFVVE